MTTAQHVALTLFITLCALLATAQAQTARLSTINVTSNGERVHIAAQGDVSEMRIEVSDEQGDVVFQSGAISGQQLDWKMRDSAGERVAAGTYLVTVTYRNAAGKLKKRVEQVTVDEAEKSSTQSPAAPQASPVPVNTTGTVTAGRIPKFVSIGPSQATVTNSIITESAGKIGINVAAPVSKLHVLSASTDKPPRLQSTGTTSFAAGWDFYNGTAPKGYVGVPGTGAGGPGPGEMLLYGSPGVKTSLWAGGSRAMTITTDGKVGIGTVTPSTGKLHVDSSDTIVAVYGKGDTGLEGQGTFDGVSGYSTSPTLGAAIYGQNTKGGFAGYFEGRVEITNGLKINAGGCTGCSPPSDRNLKANFSTVNPRFILDRLATIPIQSWNYKSEETTTRHMGPMAQDFRAAFNLGADDKTLNTVDAQGVTMAAIQGLYQMMQEKDKQNEQLTLTVQQQSHQIEQLQVQLNQVKRTIKRKRAARR